MKQVLLLRTDIDMSRGKAVAQGSHASVLATRRTDEADVETWLEENAGTKITLAVESEDELEERIKAADHLPTSIISDLGRTELDPNTKTAGAIGPASEDEIDKITGDLSLYS